MPTLKSRINITLPEDVREALSSLAKRDSMPEATKAARLLELALELEEDLFWNNMAEKRDVKHAKYVSHARAWK